MFPLRQAEKLPTFARDYNNYVTHKKLRFYAGRKNIDEQWPVTGPGTNPSFHL